MTTATLSPRIEGIGTDDSVIWGAAPNVKSGTVVAADDKGLVVTKEGRQRRLGWDTPGLRKAAAADAPVIARAIKPAILTLRLDQLSPFSLQPRTEFDEAALEELAADIRERGQHTPVIVRTSPPGAPRPYELIAGERRYRACLRAGTGTILAISRGEVSDREALAIAVSENAQRRSLNPMDEARSIDALLTFQYTQEQVGALLGGRSQEWISQTRSLLRLPSAVQDMLRQERLSRSHGRALTALLAWPKDLVAVANRAADDGLTFHALQELVREAHDRLEPRLALETEAPPKYAAGTAVWWREGEAIWTGTIVEPYAGGWMIQRTNGFGQVTLPEDRFTVGEPPAPEPEVASAPPPIVAAPEAPGASAENSTPAPDRTQPVPSQQEIAERRAAEKTSAAATPPPAEKPGFLKSASEKVAEKTGAAPAPAAPAGWEGKPVTAIIPAAVYTRLEAIGATSLEAVRGYCDLAELAEAHDLNHATCVELVRRFMAYCERISGLPDAILDEMEKALPESEASDG